MSKKFIESDELVDIANKVITENKLDYLNDVKIKYLLVDKQISKTCPCKVIKANDDLKYFSEMDYIVKFSFDIWSKIDDETKDALMLHCLCHLLVCTSEKDDERQLKIADHDIKDFALVVKKYGSDWFKTFKIAVSSIYDMKPDEVDRIKI
jgi:hypothetical protein